MWMRMVIFFLLKSTKNQNSTFLFPLPKIHVYAKLEFELTIFWVRFKLKKIQDISFYKIYLLVNLVICQLDANSCILKPTEYTKLHVRTLFSPFVVCMEHKFLLLRMSDKVLG